MQEGRKMRLMLSSTTLEWSIVRFEYFLRTCYRDKEDDESLKQVFGVQMKSLKFPVNFLLLYGLL